MFQREDSQQKQQAKKILFSFTVLLFSLEQKTGTITDVF
jgi:hypothetical protein